MKTPFALAALALAAPMLAAEAKTVTVVELYQSQGCSSCPPANAILNSLADRPDLLPLSFAVTYWDRLGWKDSFAHPAYTERQRAYSRAGGREGVATPQFIVNGRGVVTGSNRRQLEQSIAGEARDGGPAISASGGRVTIGEDRTAAPAIVWLVRYDPRVRNVKIGRGENGGRTLPHRNIVTALRQVGSWNGQPFTFAEPSYRNAGERSAVLVQAGVGGPIIAAAKL